MHNILTSDRKHKFKGVNEKIVSEVMGCFSKPDTVPQSTDDISITLHVVL